MTAEEQDRGSEPRLVAAAGAAALIAGAAAFGLGLATAADVLWVRWHPPAIGAGGHPMLPTSLFQDLSGWAVPTLVAAVALLVIGAVANRSGPLVGVGLPAPSFPSVSTLLAVAAGGALTEAVRRLPGLSVLNTAHGTTGSLLGTFLPAAVVAVGCVLLTRYAVGVAPRTVRWVLGLAVVSGAMVVGTWLVPVLAPPPWWGSWSNHWREMASAAGNADLWQILAAASLVMAVGSRCLRAVGAVHSGRGLLVTAYVICGAAAMWAASFVAVPTFFLVRSEPFRRGFGWPEWSWLAVLAVYVGISLLLAAWALRAAARRPLDGRSVEPAEPELVPDAAA